MPSLNFDRIDKYIFDRITFVVLKWIKKKKHQSHKFDFFLHIQTLEMAYWMFALIYQGYEAYKRTNWIGAGLFMLLMVIILVFEVLKTRDMVEMKDAYDWIWERRKDPVVYQTIKELCGESFEHGKKSRIISLKLNIFFGVLMSFVNPILIPIYLFSVLAMYYSPIFDFDDPPKKEKREKDSITEVAMRAFKQLTAGLSPANN